MKLRTIIFTFTCLLAVTIGFMLLKATKPHRSAVETEEPQPETDASRRIHRKTRARLENSASAEADLLQLQGRVSLPDGRPVTDAWVSLVAKGPRGAIPLRTQSNAMGMFHFEGLLAGAYQLQAGKEDKASLMVEGTLSSASSQVDLVLLAAASMKVEVRDIETDQPISNAMVKVWAGNVAHPRIEHTDAQGFVNFVGLSLANYDLAVEAAGYASHYQRHEEGRNAGKNWKTMVFLTPGVQVSGQVVDAHHKPLANATVSAQNASQPSPQNASGLFYPNSSFPRAWSVKTDDNGNFALTVPQGRCVLVASHPSTKMAKTPELDTSSGQAVEGIEIVLDSGRKLSGQVVNKAGMPVSAAQVIVTTVGHPYNPLLKRLHRFQQVTDEDGWFAFEGLDPIAVAISASNAEAKSELVEVDLRTDSQEDVTVALEHDATIDGVVLDDRGKPVASALIDFTQVPSKALVEAAIAARSLSGSPTLARMGSSPNAVGSVHSRADGTFTLRGLVPGEEYLISARRGEHSQVAPNLGRRSTRAKPGDTVQIALPGLGGIRGRLVDAQGKSLTHFQVALADVEAARVGAGPAQTFSSDDGTFELHPIPARHYVVTFSGNGVRPTKHNVLIEGSNTVDLGTIQMAQGHSFSGIVRTEQGQRAPGARVTVVSLQQGTGSMALQADGRGRFELHSLPQGTFRIRAASPEGVSEWVTLTEATGSIELVLSSTLLGSVSGHVEPATKLAEKQQVLLVPDGREPSGSELRFGDIPSAQIDKTGSFSIDRVPRGRYRAWTLRTESTQENAAAWIQSDAFTVDAGQETRGIVLAVADVGQ